MQQGSEVRLGKHYCHCSESVTRLKKLITKDQPFPPTSVHVSGSPSARRGHGGIPHEPTTDQHPDSKPGLPVDAQPLSVSILGMPNPMAATT